MPITSHIHTTNTVAHGHHVPHGTHHLHHHGHHHGHYNGHHHGQQEYAISKFSKDSEINQIQIGNCDSDCVTIKTDTGIDHNNFDIFTTSKILSKFKVTSNIHHTEGVGQTTTNGEFCISYKGDVMNGNLCTTF